MAFLTPAQATLFDYDPFDYTGTDLAAQNRPTGWNGAWFTTAGSQANTLSGDGLSLSYPVPFESPLTTPASAGSHVKTGGLAGNASTSRLLSHTINLAVDGTVAYASALVTKNAANGGGVNNDNVLLEFVDSAGNRRWGFGIEGTGDKPWVNANGSATAPTAVTPGQTYLLVTKIVSSATGSDTAYLKVYGGVYGTQFPAAEPTVWDATATETTAAVLDRIRVRIDAGNTASVPGEVDDIRIGTSWQDVVSVLQPITDTTPPTVLTADCLLSNMVNVIFSEPVDPTTAQDTGSYTLAGHTVTGVTLLAGVNAQVTLDSPITANYTIGVQNVKDLAGNTMLSTNLAGILHVEGWENATSISITNGMAYAMGDKIVMFADGSDVSGTADHFGYLYKTVSGDFDLSVRVESLLRTGNNARAGLMARTDTFLDSPNVMIEAVPDRFIFQYRPTAGGTTTAVASPRPPTAFPNSWIRLVRSGSVFTGYSSTNYGVFWDQISSVDTGANPVPTDLLVGLVASANNAAETTRAQFSGFGRSVVLVAPTLAVAPAGSNMEVSWGTGSIGFTLQSTPSLAAPIIWTTVPGSSVTNRVFTPAGSAPLFFRAVYPAP